MAVFFRRPGLPRRRNRFLASTLLNVGSVGATAGTGAAAAVGISTAASTFAATGAGAAAAVGLTLGFAGGDGAAAGTGAAAAVGAYTVGVAAGASGTGTASGIGTAITAAIGAAAGVSVTTHGVGQTITGGSAGFCVGMGAAVATSATLTTANNPTFNGAVNGRTVSNYMSVDGGDYFDEVANGAWDTNWHKAAAKFTFAAIVWPVAGTVVLLGSESNVHSVGTKLFSNGTNWILRRANGSAEQDLTLGAVTLNAWNFIGVSLNEAGGAAASHWRVNATTGTFDGAKTSPSSAAPSNKMRILGSPDGTNLAPSGTLLMSLQAWKRNISAADMTALYALWKSERVATI